MLVSTAGIGNALPENPITEDLATTIQESLATLPYDGVT